MSIKAPSLETPEARKACDLMANIKSIMSLVGVEPAMAIDSQLLAHVLIIVQ